MADDMTPGIASGATEDEMPDAALTNDMRDEFVDMPGTASAASTEDQSADEEDLSYSIYDQPDRVGLFEGDVGDLPAEARYALTRLVRDRYVDTHLPGRPLPLPQQPLPRPQREREIPRGLGLHGSLRRRHARRRAEARRRPAS